MPRESRRPACTPNHAQSQFVEGVMTREKVTTMLESCQRERDRAMLMLWLIGL